MAAQREVVDAAVLHHARCLDALVKKLPVISTQDDGRLPVRAAPAAQLCNLVACLRDTCRVAVLVRAAHHDIVVVLAVFLHHTAAHRRNQPPVVFVAHIVTRSRRCVEGRTHHLVAHGKLLAYLPLAVSRLEVALVVAVAQRLHPVNLGIRRSQDNLSPHALYLVDRQFEEVRHLRRQFIHADLPGQQTLYLRSVRIQRAAYPHVAQFPVLRVLRRCQVALHRQQSAAARQVVRHLRHGRLEHVRIQVLQPTLHLRRAAFHHLLHVAPGTVGTELRALLERNLSLRRVVPGLAQIALVRVAVVGQPVSPLRMARLSGIVCLLGVLRLVCHTGTICIAAPVCRTIIAALRHQTAPCCHSVSRCLAFLRLQHHLHSCQFHIFILFVICLVSLQYSFSFSLAVPPIRFRSMPRHTISLPSAGCR